MSTKYKEIDFGFEHLDSVIKTLRRHNERGELVFGEFNGHKLYSDEDEDSIYKKVVGKTKAEHDAWEKEWHDERERELKEHKEKIPSLTEEWINKGNEILDEKYQEYWAKCVPIRLGDLYRGMELGCTLDIVKPLNEGCDMETAKSIIDEQGHSGMSFGLVCSMVASFCDRGREFVQYVK